MLYKQIILEWGQDTESGVWGLGYSPDNGKNFYVLNTTHGRKYRAEDGNRLYPYISDQVQDKIDTAVTPAKSAADSAVAYANNAIENSRVNSQAIEDINSAVSDAKQGANDAMIQAKSAWDVATGAKEAVTDFDPLIKSAQSDASKALTQIADTANALSDAKTSFGSDVAVAKNLASTAQTTANNAVESASSVANDLAAVASQAKANASGITKVTSDVGLLQTTVADNSGNISTIQETAKQIQQAVSDNAGNITTAKQTADSAVAVASDAKSNATVAVQTASGASVTAKNAQGDATTAITTAKGAVTQASDAKSNATIAVQTASEASLTATNAQGDASIAKQTASDASVQIKNAQGDISKLQTQAGTIEASVANNSGAIASVQQTANGLTTTVADIKANGGGRNLLQGTGTASGDVAGGNGTFVKGAFNGYDAVKTNTAWSERRINLKSALGRTNAKAGDWYTISVYVKADKQINDGFLGVYRALGNGDANTNDGFLDGIPMQNKPITTQWQQYSWSFQINDISLQRQNTRVEYSQDTGDNWIYWAGWMLEKGTVAHDWSPAPDDLQNQFTQTKESIDGITTIINDPKTGLNATYQTAAGNASTISNVKGDVTQLQTTANGLTSRVGNLESKTNTQQTAIEQNKNAITLKADQTDVDTVKGTVAGLQSSLTVQGNQIQSKVSASDVSGMLKGYATQDYTQSLVTQKADDWNVNLTKLKNDTQTSLTNLAVGVEGVQAQVYNSDGSSKITQLSSLIATKVSQGDYNSQITQLKNDINLQVKKGDVISQINQEAGGNTLIQVSNGKGSLILNADNTIITGKAWIPDAALSSISADKIMLGSTSLYNSDGTLNLVNKNDGTTSKITVSQGNVNFDGVNKNASIIKFASDNNTNAFTVNPTGATVTPTLFFERFDQTVGHWLGFTRNEVEHEGVTFHTWDDEAERFFISCHARCDKNLRVLGTLSQGSWDGTTAKPEAGVLTIKSGNTIWSGSDFLAVGSNVTGTYTGIWAKSFSQLSMLSSKTNIETVNPKDALDLVNRTDIRSYQYKTDVAQGKTKRYTSLIIDDVNDVSQYYAPDEFTNEERTGRDDGSAVGYLFLAVKELTRRIENLEEKLNG